MTTAVKAAQRPAPAVALACLLVLALFVAPAQPTPTLFGAVLLASCAAVFRRRIDATLLIRQVRRLRWLFLALLITHLWFTPGRAWVPALGPWSPSVEGGWLALWRGLALLQLVAAAGLLFALYSRDELVAALCSRAAAQGSRGGLYERALVRLALTLAAVAQMPALLAARQQPVGNAWRRAAATAVWIHAHTLDQARQPEQGRVALACLPAPAARAWLLPAALVAAFVLVAAVVPGGMGAGSAAKAVSHSPARGR